MKKSILTFAILFALLASAFSFAIPASAATATEPLFQLDSACNVIIDIAYDTSNEPVVSIISPSGVTYTYTTQRDGVTVERDTTNKYVRFYVPDARAGNWRITYDTAFKGHLEVNVVRYSRDIEIAYFDITSLTGSSAQVAFRVDFPKSVRYNYTISAVTLTESGKVDGKKELYSSTANSGREAGCTVQFSSLQSYDSYYLMLEVRYDDYGTEVTHSMLSDSFGYVNGNAHAPITDYIATLNVTTGQLSVDWSHCYKYATEYNLAVVADGETVYANKLAGEITSVDSISVNPASAEIQVSLSYLKNGRYSEIYTVSIFPSAMGVTIPTAEITSSTQAEISYAVNTECDAYVSVDDTFEEKVLLKGSGSFSVSLKSGKNKLTVKQIYSENVILIAQKDIFVDVFAPVLRFFENLTNITTENTEFVVVGEVESGCTFTVNGVAQTPNADGTFSIPLTLAYGMNNFEFVATDAAGNVSKRVVSIACSNNAVIGGAMSDFSLEELILLGVGIAVLLALLIALLVMKKSKKLNLQNILTLVFILCLVATTAVSTITVIKLLDKSDLGNIVNGEQFFEIVKESIDKANDYLVRYEEVSATANMYLLISGIALGVCAILLTVKLILKKRANKKANSKVVESAAYVPQNNGNFNAPQ